MSNEEAKNFLIDISYKLGNMGIEYLTEKDGEKMREAIEVLGQATAAKDITTDMSIQLMLEKKAIEKDLEQNPIDMDMTKGLVLGLLLGINKKPDEKDKLMEYFIKIVEPEQTKEVLDKIKEEIEALPKTFSFVDHHNIYLKESDVKKVIDKYKGGNDLDERTK